MDILKRGGHAVLHGLCNSPALADWVNEWTVGMEVMDVV